MNWYLLGGLWRRNNRASCPRNLGHINGYRSVQKKRHYSADSPILTHDVQLCDVSVGVWCSTVQLELLGLPPFFSETINSHRHVTHFLTTFSNIYPITWKIYVVFSARRCNSCTANNCVPCLHSTLGEADDCGLLVHQNWTREIPICGACKCYLFSFGTLYNVGIQNHKFSRNFGKNLAFYAE